MILSVKKRKIGEVYLKDSQLNDDSYVYNGNSNLIVLGIKNKKRGSIYWVFGHFMTHKIITSP